MLVAMAISFVAFVLLLRAAMRAVAIPVLAVPFALRRMTWSVRHIRDAFASLRITDVCGSQSGPANVLKDTGKFLFSLVSSNTYGLEYAHI